MFLQNSRRCGHKWYGVGQNQLGSVRVYFNRRNDHRGPHNILQKKILIKSHLYCNTDVMRISSLIEIVRKCSVFLACMLVIYLAQPFLS